MHVSGVYRVSYRSPVHATLDVMAQFAPYLLSGGRDRNTRAESKRSGMPTIITRGHHLT